MKDLQDLEITRDYNVSLDRLWSAVTQPEQIAQWLGPEGTRLERCDVDFSQLGPYTCVMIGLDSGNRFKVSGQVTHVQPPEDGSGSVGFTWAWHDDQDQRGHESHVTFSVQPTDTGARLILTHRGLASEEQSLSHESGWQSTLSKLDKLLT